MMIIEQIDLYHVKMPLLEPWVTAYGSQNDIESVFVKIASDGIAAGVSVHHHLYPFTIQSSQQAPLLLQGILWHRALLGKRSSAESL
jgi:hypothetical protein